MKNVLLTIATVSVLLVGQSAMANNNSEEFLSWLDGGQEIVQVNQSSQFNKVSMMNQNTIDTQADAFSLDYSSDK